MKKRFEREEILGRLRAHINKGQTILGAGCSAGIIAKCAELGGADLIICYSTGISRLRGLQTETIGHSNPITLGMFDEIQNVVRDTPIIAGVMANDQTDYDLDRMIQKFIDQRFDGVINFPTQADIEMRLPSVKDQNDARGKAVGISWGFAREVEMIRKLRDRNVFTMCYVYTPQQAADMVKAGVDVVCAHVGGTSGGLIGFLAAPLEKSLENAQKIMEGAWAVDSSAICLAHGGPFAEPEDLQALYEQTDAQGFVGASSIERIPVEKAVMGTVKAFKNFRFRQRKGDEGH